MSTLLEKTFNEIKKLPETEQNIFAKWILEELEAERKWDKLFAESEDISEKLAEEALKEHKEGKTEVLDFNKLWFQEPQQNFGNIINIASIYGIIPPRFEIYENTEMTTPIEYNVIKHSIVSMTKYVAKYYKGFNIRANCISPGGILNNQSQEFLDKYNKFSLNKGMLERKDISGTLLFLISDMSKYVNGQNIIVDDGWSLWI